VTNQKNLGVLLDQAVCSPKLKTYFLNLMGSDSSKEMKLKKEKSRDKTDLWRLVLAKNKKTRLLKNLPQKLIQ
jgi:hypothetical protein